MCSVPLRQPLLEHPVADVLAVGPQLHYAPRFSPQELQEGSGRL